MEVMSGVGELIARICERFRKCLRPRIVGQPRLLETLDLQPSLPITPGRIRHIGIKASMRISVDFSDLHPSSPLFNKYSKAQQRHQMCALTDRVIPGPVPDSQPNKPQR